jgi:hypothetical protein
MQNQVLDIYNRDIHNALRELLDRTRQAQTNLILRKSSGMADTFTPGSTCEEIAMTAIEQASRARTLQEVIELTSRVYASLFEREKSDRDF